MNFPQEKKTGAWLRSQNMKWVAILSPIESEIDRDPSRLKRVLLSVSVILGLIPAIAGYSYGGDTVSYLDMGDAFFAGHWEAIFNGLWSPLYPFLLGLTRWMLKPSMRWEPLVMQLTNFLIFMTTVLAFQFFWDEVLRFYRQMSKQEGSMGLATFGDGEFWVLGYVIFLSLYLPLLNAATPDMLLSTIVYLAAGLMLRIRQGGPTLGRFCLFGLLLALGFLTKAVMLPLAGVFLVTAALCTARQRFGITYSLIAALVFAGIAGPYVFGLSKTEGHFTLGKSPNLNYAWHVNGAPFIHWQGELAGLGKPEHPTRKIFSSPQVYEFGSPVSATYAPWYDPSYWNEGLRARFDWAEQVSALEKSLHEYFGEFKSQAVLIVGVLLLLAMRAVGRTALREYLTVWYLWVPALAAFTIYGLVWVEDRYVAQFFVLFWGTVLTLVRLPEGRDSRRLIRTVTAIVVALVSIQVAPYYLRDAVHGHREAAWQMHIAEGLADRGVRAGEKVAVLDAGLGDAWQKLLRVSVVAEIPYEEDNKFWAADQSRKTQIYEALAKTGANFLITTQIPEWASTRGWEKIEGTPAYVFYLDR